MMGWYNNGYGPWMAGGGFIMMFGFMLIVGLVLFMLFRRNGINCCGHHDNGHSGKNNALETLRERYAKGEIDSTEFNQKRQDLEK